jgi:hypothetical protein
MLGHYKYENGVDFIKSDEFAKMIENYKDCILVENIPEKGERRISDDYIYLIDEIFSD